MYGIPRCLGIRRQGEPEKIVEPCFDPEEEHGPHTFTDSFD